MTGVGGGAGRLPGRHSFIELSARERARAILDAGTFRELLGPFERLKSPWLELQGVVAQSDDGVVIARGCIAGVPAVVAAIEGAYQGGSVGEVSGAKIAGALELSLRDCERGRPVRPVLVLESGGVRLQEANLGLAAAAEVHAAIVALRRHQPVVGVVAGLVGCFGGMSLAAALCSHLIVTRQARLGMNGPEVIEQEAGVGELDASDRALVWSLLGGEQRYASGLADALVEDDAQEIAAEVRRAFQGGAQPPRSEQAQRFLERLAAIDPDRPPAPQSLRAVGPPGGTTVSPADDPAQPGLRWLTALTASAGLLERGPRTVRLADAPLGTEAARFIAVVPDRANRFPRARQGELGLEEGWTLALLVRATITADRGLRPRPIVAIVDVPSQAYGRREELLGVHLACAGAVDAYASARLAGHPIVALLVGKAMSGAFLAHGYQANRILALDSPQVLVHAMSKPAAARVTRRPVAELEELGARIPPLAYDIASFARLGLLHRLISGVSAASPSPQDVDRVRGELAAAIADTRAGGRDLAPRLTSAAARTTRAASIAVRRRLAEQWDAS